MTADSASRTAWGVARRRAAHQILDQPLVFRDPLAERIILDPTSPAISADVNSSGSRALRAFVAARSRYAEDQAAAFFRRGVTQYVVLGAGLDTFGYRNPYEPALKVFEVDHPNTQAWKRERLRAAAIALPDSLTFVPVNFEDERLDTALRNTPEFDVTRPSFFSLLGVTPYLTKEAWVTTLQIAAGMPAGSGIAFDYAVPASSLNPWEQVALEMLSARVARIGEPFRLFLDPREVSQLLGELGFIDIEDLGQPEINALYFRDREDGLRIASAAGRMLSARVGTARANIV
ncbi:MAG TPA: SAM-dependent methyltransferase [Bryobacteraceae bacterium]|nr:SAM-dependent methyltransferase [Bryobacteraceae bacterium]